MPTKDELIADAKKMSISLPSGKLSKAELEATTRPRTKKLEAET